VGYSLAALILRLKETLPFLSLSFKLDVSQSSFRSQTREDTRGYLRVTHPGALEIIVAMCHQPTHISRNQIFI